jgi:type VI secretion system secreted protein Hcp
MAFDAFMKIANVPGESTDSKHQEWIEILSFSHGMSQPSSASVSRQGGVTVGRVDMHDLSVVKALDKASPKLALACCKGEHFATVQIELCKAADPKQKYMDYKLSDCIVSSVRPAGTSHGAEELPLEEVSFRFGKIEWNYTALDPKSGKPKGNVAAGWDLSKNAPV